MKRISFIILSLSVIMLLTASALGGAPDAGFQPLDTFDNMPNGSINGQGDWVGNEPGAPDGALVWSEGPQWFKGKTLRNNPDNYPNRGNAYRALNGQTINDGSLATLYFQVSVDDLSQAAFSVGLSTESAPAIFGNNPTFDHFGVEVRFNSQGLVIRNGNQYQAMNNFTLPTSGLMHVWLLIDHNDNEFEVYVDHPDRSRMQVATAGGPVFSFRDGTNASLKSFVVQNDGTPSSDSFIDSLYLDPDSNELGYPAGNFELVESFDGRNLGGLNGQNGWSVGNGSGEVINDPATLGNRVALITGTDTNLYINSNHHYEFCHSCSCW